MSSIIKGLKSVREQEKFIGSKKWDWPEDWPKDREEKEDDEFQREPVLGTGPTEIGAAPKRVKISYDDSEGIIDGKRYNKILKIKTKDPVAADSALKRWEDVEWGAKEIVKKDSESDPNNTLVYIIDNHKYGTWKPFKDEPGKDPFKFGEDFKSGAQPASNLNEVEGTKLDPKQVTRKAFQIVRQIAYDDTVPQILVQIDTLADEYLAQDKRREYEQALDSIYQARNHLESEIYKLSELFAKDPFTDEDEFGNDLYESSTAKKKVYKIKSSGGDVLDLDGVSQYSTREAAQAALSSLDEEEQKNYRIISVTVEGYSAGAGQSYRKFHPKKSRKY